MSEEITSIKTTEGLSDLLEGFCFTNGLPLRCADELRHELLSHLNWLNAFCDHWNKVQAEEDFEQAIAARGER